MNNVVITELARLGLLAIATREVPHGKRTEATSLNPNTFQWLLFTLATPAILLTRRKEGELDYDSTDEQCDLQVSARTSHLLWRQVSGNYREFQSFLYLSTINEPE